MFYYDNYHPKCKEIASQNGMNASDFRPHYIDIIKFISNPTNLDGGLYYYPDENRHIYSIIFYGVKQNKTVDVDLDFFHVLKGMEDDGFMRSGYVKLVTNDIYFSFDGKEIIVEDVNNIPDNAKIKVTRFELQVLRVGTMDHLMLIETANNIKSDIQKILDNYHIVRFDSIKGDLPLPGEGYVEVPLCTGSLPGNAVLCSNTQSGLESDLTWQQVEQSKCNDRKCQYYLSDATGDGGSGDGTGDGSGGAGGSGGGGGSLISCADGQEWSAFHQSCCDRGWGPDTC
jgi:uncharacterized membrane protein YgcG